MVKMTMIAAAMLTAFASIPASATAPQKAPRVVEQADVPERDGAATVAVLKSGKKLETVTCRDFGLVDESFRPQAVTYAANYGPKSKAHPTMTVSGVERIVPVVVDACQANPGDHFVTAVQRALKAQRH